MIEKNIPLPPPQSRKRGRFSEIGDLEVGDSCTFPRTDYNSLCSVLQYHQKTHSKRFTRRTEDELIRVWRTE